MHVSTKKPSECLTNWLLTAPPSTVAVMDSLIHLAKVNKHKYINVPTNHRGETNIADIVKTSADIVVVAAMDQLTLSALNISKLKRALPRKTVLVCLADTRMWITEALKADLFFIANHVANGVTMNNARMGETVHADISTLDAKRCPPRIDRFMSCVSDVVPVVDMKTFTDIYKPSICRLMIVVMGKGPCIASMSLVCPKMITLPIKSAQLDGLTIVKQIVKHKAIDNPIRLNSFILDVEKIDGRKITTKAAEFVSYINTLYPRLVGEVKSWGECPKKKSKKKVRFDNRVSVRIIS